MYQEWKPKRSDETDGGELTDRDLTEIQLMARNANAGSVVSSDPDDMGGAELSAVESEGLDGRLTLEVQPPPVLDDVVSPSVTGPVDAALLKEYQQYLEFLEWKKARETMVDAPKEYVREPQTFHNGYSCTIWERSDFMSSTIVVTAPEPDPEKGRGDKHDLHIAIVTDANRRLEFPHTFHGTKWETVIEAIADNARITIDGHEFEGDVMPHPERTWNACVRGLGDNILAGVYEQGAFRDPDRTRKLGLSIVEGDF